MTLEEYVERMGRGHRRFDLLFKLYKEFKENKVRLIDPCPPRTFYEYFIRLDYSLWYFVLLVLVFATLASIVLTGIVPGIIYLRYVLGSIFVLFLPGYTTIEALYPEEHRLSPLERLALSIGLSLAVTPLLGLLLNYTPWGIRLEPILAALSVYTLLIGLYALYRKYQLLVRRLRIQSE